MLTTNSAPQISVIIPTYNCERYITEAVESVLSQRGCFSEIIVIDDGSTDNTRQILAPYSDRLSYIYQENQGVCLARNHGIQLAKGELIAFLDADDLFLPGKLAAQLKVFQIKPELGIVHSGWRRTDFQGNILTDIRPWQNCPKLNLQGWLIHKPVLPSAMMFRREWLEDVGGFDPKYSVAEDVDLVLRLALKGCQAAWLRQITVCYRQREQSAMSDGLSQAQCLTAILDNFFSQPNLPERIRLIENEVRYTNLVWIAWYLYYTGQPKEMVNYLQQAWYYTPYLPIETIVHWAESFTQYSQNWGISLDADTLGKSPEWRRLTQAVINYAKKQP